MKNIAGIVTVLALAVALNGVVVTPAHAETTTSNISSLMETVKSLLAKVAELQKEIAKVRGEIKDTKEDIHETLKDGLKEGMTHEDIKKVQELLAADTEIYPEGMVTGYYGKLTKEAIKRFQTKHNIKVSGELDDETKDLIEEYFGERSNGKFPQGIFHAPGILKKIQGNFCEKKGPSFGGWFCRGWDWSDDDHEDDDNTDAFEVEVEIEDGVTTVSFTFKDKDYTVAVDSTKANRVLTEVAGALKVQVLKLDSDLKKEILNALQDAVAEEGKVTKEEAQDALDDASDAIEAVQEDIDDVDDDVDTDEVEDALQDAEDLLADGEEEFADKDYAKAETLANKALKKAQEAADLLEEAIEDAA